MAGGRGEGADGLEGDTTDEGDRRGRFVGIAMDFAFTPEEEAFRQEVRAFLQAELRDRPPGGPEAWQFYRDFIKKLAERGWLTLAWPKEWGGQGASHMKQLVYNEEVSYYDAPANDMGSDRVGPTIMLYGTEEQKERYLPSIVRGEAVW
ncbi:MAG: acyl-CoA dehydrogenase family protein, partial [Chloroflexi bacterium]|nr:acyl-CoA dehydrogenase family protein [Chloroflexota bacterium]